MSASEKLTRQRRIWSDPYFFVTLGVVSGAYVTLILAMLLADAIYIFTSKMTRPVNVDFAFSSNGTRLLTGDTVSTQFEQYGLTVSSNDDGHPPVIIDSGRPSADHSDLGTPHVDFGGPGIGRGGREFEDGEFNPSRNNIPFGNVLTIASNQPPYPEIEQSQVVINWTDPVDVNSITVDESRDLTGRIRLFDVQGEQIADQRVESSADDGQHAIDVEQQNISRLVAEFPETDGQVRVEFTGGGQVATRIASADSQTLKQGNVYVVPGGSRQVVPSHDGGQLVFTWEDPIQLDGLSLLNIDQAGGKVRTFNEAGDPLTQHDLIDTGENGLQTIELKDAAGEVRTGQADVARVEVDLPGGGAVTEIDFTWTGRIRSQWEREHPRLARLVHNPITTSLAKPEIQYSVKLSLISCTITAILSLWVAIPVGYLLSRHQFPGRSFIDAVLDIPIVLPPLVVGISLLILFQSRLFWFREHVVYEIPAVILAQFAVACAFAVRTMRATFDQIDARREQVALTLGCSRFQAFGMVVLPEASRGILTAGTLAWARALGEFGPLLIFAGATRNKTEVLSTTVFLEMSIGDLGAAVAVSLIMVVAAVIVLIVARLWGSRSLTV